MRKILVSAYACEPLKGSEQGVGWNWVLQMANKNKVYVITRANNQHVIENNLPQNVASNITFHYYDTHKIIRKFKNKAKGLYFYYFCWQIGIIPLIKKLKEEVEFDYSMHLTFGSMWMPTFLPLFNIPFIWGPIGGGDNEPSTFSSILSLKERFLHYLRAILNKIAIINPFFLFTVSRAKVILVRTNNSANIIPARYRNKIRIVVETSMEGEIFRYKKEYQYLENKKIKLVSSGRLMPSKNILTAIKAINEVKNVYEIEYIIIGSGTDKKRIENEIKKLNIEDNIGLISEIPRHEVLKELSDSDIYLFPSLREGGSWALMEAMAVGLPVICLNWSGMAIITDEECAIRLPVMSPKKMVIDMAEAICKLIKEPELRKKMGENGRSRIKQEFTWKAKGDFMEKLLMELDEKK